MVDKVRAIAADNAAVVGKLSTVFSAVKEMKLTLFIVSAALGAMVVVPLLLQWNETDTPQNTIEPELTVDGGQTTMQQPLEGSPAGGDATTQTVELSDGETVWSTETYDGVVIEDNIGYASGVLNPIEERIEPQELQGAYGTLSVDAGRGWVYALSHDAVQFLGETDHVDELFAIQLKEGVEQTVKILVRGSDDLAVVKGNVGQVQEDQQGVAEGTVKVVDVDDEVSQKIIPISTDTPYGHFTLEESGTWRYELIHSAVQNLSGEKQITDILLFALSDETKQTITITIMGSEDAAIVVGDRSAEVTRGDVESVDGVLRIMDVDYGDDPQFMSGVMLGQFGVVSIDEEGRWSYQLDAAAVEHLFEGDRVEDTFSVTATDNTHQDIVIMIHGSGHAVENEKEVTQAHGWENTAVEGGIGITGLESQNIEVSIEDIESGLSEVGNTIENGVLDLLGIFSPLVEQLEIEPPFDPDASASIVQGIEEIKIDPMLVERDSEQKKQQVDVELEVTNGAADHETADSSVLTDEEQAAVSDTTSDGVDGVVTEDSMGYADGVFTFDPQLKIKPQEIAGYFGVLSVDAGGAWLYAMDNDAVQHLGEEEEIEELLTVTLAEGVERTVNITIRGNKDVATIEGNLGEVEEDMVGIAGGKIYIDDVDGGNPPKIIPATSEGVYGHFVLQEDGVWQYELDHTTVQNLDEDKTTTDTMLFELEDGSRHAIIITIYGSEDLSVVGGMRKGEVTEDGVGIAEGLLRIMDIDYGDDPLFKGEEVPGNYGLLMLDDEGYWKYELDHQSVENLNGGDKVVDTITLTASDETVQDILITVYGNTDAEEVIDGPVYTLQDIVSYVVDNHPDVVKAREELSANNHLVEFAKAGFRPTVELAANVGEELGAQKENMVMTLTQMLFNGNATKNEVKKSDADYKIAKATLDTVENDLVYKTVQAYMDLIRARAIKKLHTNHLSAHKRVYKQVELRFIQGVGNPSDLSQVEAKLSNAEANIISAETEYLDAAARYISLADEVPENIKSPTLEIPMPESIEIALERAQELNAKLESKRLDVDKANAIHEITKSPFLPTLNMEVVGNYDRKGGTVGQEKDISAMLKMSYMLYNGNRDQSMRQESAFRINAAKEAFDAAVRVVKEELSIAWHAYERQRKLVPFLSDKAVANRKTRETYEKQYKLNQSTLLEILGAETEMLGSDTLLLNAENDLFMSKFRVLQTMGLLDKIFGY
ncbi:MAG: TolC family outer membrane protein [Gammaproteobacteria bacterium]|nr:TolC family outer membrane protein [Gammaproteobacteria bacterium]MBT3488862.1 TolC family outer membrane protein [Gammaproteobacteria bacterium]MBT3844506.1 TolC family outer membrane protein [Gammaproteobacteria bacterium]MBT3891960.1 TolC family outer membrane protein [Gammaproteobacteria bacterium]MBT4549382.1 TolC family outer membrane protein [Gammaproteobacteria bacterium]